MGSEFPHEGTEPMAPLRGNRGPVTRTGLFSIGGKFGVSLGGSQTPPSFWQVPGLPRISLEVPRRLPRKFSVDLRTTQRFPRLS